MGNDLVKNIEMATRFQDAAALPTDNTDQVNIGLDYGQRQANPTSRPPEAQKPAPVKPAKERQIFYHI